MRESEKASRNKSMDEVTGTNTNQIASHKKSNIILNDIKNQEMTKSLVNKGIEII